MEQIYPVDGGQVGSFLTRHRGQTYCEVLQLSRGGG